MEYKRSMVRQMAAAATALVFLLIALQLKAAQDTYSFSVHQFEQSTLASEEKLLRQTVGRTVEEIQWLSNTGQYAALPVEAQQEALLALLRPLIQGANAQQTGYTLWIDELLLPQGGQGYARRLLDPANPGAEGELLSTQAQDPSGQRPYAIQLEALQATGEALINFTQQQGWRQLPQSLRVYGVLMSSHNWIVCAGYEAGTYRPSHSPALESLRQQLQANTIGFILIALLCLSAYVFLLRRMDQSTAKLFKDACRRLNEKERELSIATNKVEKAYADLLRVGALDASEVMHNHPSLAHWLDSNFDGFTRLTSEALLAGGQATALAVIALDDSGRFCRLDYSGTGETLLQAISDCLDARTRKSDLVARWHDDSFLLVLHNISLKDALGRVEDLRANIQRMEVACDGIMATMTVTCGLSMMLAQDKSWKQALARAEKALNRGQEGSMNTVCHDIFQ